MSRFGRVWRKLFGERPRMAWLLVTPTLIGILIDWCVRPRSLLDFPIKEIVNYVGSSAVGCGFWGAWLWVMSRFLASGKLGLRIVGVAFFALVYAPFAFFAYGGQILYYRIFHAYIARDTVRLGIALRGTLGAWLSAWQGKTAIAII